jgi:hypothetical protein
MPWTTLTFMTSMLAYQGALAAGPTIPKPYYELSEPELSARLAAIRREPLRRRLDMVSAGFLGAPYKIHPLGEGPDARFDRGPLHDFQAFDCTTYIEQVMALAIEPRLPAALGILRKIRYRNGTARYGERNHFPEADWIPNNIRAGFLIDVTARLAGPATREATKTISKRRWYAGKTEQDLHGFEKAPPSDIDSKLAALRALGQDIPDGPASLPYLPLSRFAALESLIPSGTIANLVREDDPNAPTLVTHQGFLIRKDGALYFRHASERLGRVVDEKAGAYFASYAKSRRKLLGINLLEVARGPSSRSPGVGAAP